MAWAHHARAVPLSLAPNPFKLYQYSIEGDIDIAGRINPTTNLLTATSLDFITPPPASVTFADGSFAAAGIGVGTTATMFDFTFDPLAAAGAQVWSIALGGFSFRLDQVLNIDRTANTLGIQGTGTMSGTGLDNTPYAWSFSANRTVVGTSVRISFSENNTPTPEPASMLLLGSGLLGLGLWGRKMRKSA